MQEVRIDHWAAPSIAEDWGRFCGGTVYIVGTGTSLTGFDHARLRGKTTIALNDAAFALPDATYHLYGDSEIFGRYFDLPYGEATKIVVQNSVALALRNSQWRHRSKLRVFVRPRETSLYDITYETDALWMSRTVAAPAIMMAWKLGAADIYLLGVDCYRKPDGTCYADGKAHADKYVPQGKTDAGNIIEDRHYAWMQGFEFLQGYLNFMHAQHGTPLPHIYTVSDDSPCATWPKRKLEYVL